MNITFFVHILPRVVTDKFLKGVLSGGFTRFILYELWINSECALENGSADLSNSAFFERSSFRTGKLAFWLASFYIGYWLAISAWRHNFRWNAVSN